MAYRLTAEPQCLACMEDGVGNTTWTCGLPKGHKGVHISLSVNQVWGSTQPPQGSQHTSG